MKSFITATLLSLLSAAAAAQAPTASHKASVTLNPDSTVTLTNGKVSARFDAGRSFDILSLRLSDSDELVRPGNNKYPWTITYLGAQGQKPEMNGSFGTFAGFAAEHPDDTTATAAFRWEMLLNYDGKRYPVTMRASVTDNSDLIAWTIEAGLPEGWNVASIRFPEISVETPDSASVITPAGWGNLYRLEQNGVYEANYPSWSASMQMVMLDDGNGALYYCGEDRDASGKLFTVKEKDGNVTFSTTVTPSEAWADPATGTFTLPWRTVTGHHADGWQAAAMHWYRPFTFTTSWGSAEVESASDKAPQWLRDKDLWFRVKNVDEEARTSSDRIVDFFGDNIMFHWYVWHHHAYDSHYPDYFPAQPEFKPIIDRVHERDCHIVPYINGRLWDPCSDSFTSRKGHEAVCRRPDGTLYTELYLYVNTVACPATPLWNDIMHELTDSVIAIGTDGIYIDQIAAAAPHPCYAEGHPHPKGGGDFWVKAYRKMMDTLRTDCLHPGQILFSEENSECFIDKFDILLTLNTPHSPKCHIVPLYPMIYSDRTRTAGFTYTPGTDMTTGAFRHINMQCFLYGSQLGWVEPRFLWASDTDCTEAAFLKTLADFRKQQHDVFEGGRYLREIIPAGDNPVAFVPEFGDEHKVKGAEWLAADGSKVLYLVNSDDVPHTVAIPHSAAPLTLEAKSVRRMDL